MSDLTKNLIDAIISGKATDIETTFQATMADKISDAMEERKVSVAQGMFKESKGYASGDWHVVDDITGKIHSTHSTPRKAKNAAEKLNIVDYDANKDDESRSSGNLFHNRYGTQAASEYNKKGIKEAYSDKNPKIDFYHKDTGEYLASTNFSPTVKHAVAGYETKYPDMVGKVKASKATK